MILLGNEKVVPIIEFNGVKINDGKKGEICSHLQTLF